MNGRRCNNIKLDKYSRLGFPKTDDVHSVGSLAPKVTALGDSKSGLNPSQQQVFDAQMAVGDSQKYPAFAGNVFSVDTRPMCRPQEASPGGRDRFASNAESYLEIGDAMA